eukprot:1941655-Prymnesium_polylepis.2
MQRWVARGRAVSGGHTCIAARQMSGGDCLAMPSWISRQLAPRSRNRSKENSNTNEDPKPVLNCQSRPILLLVTRAQQTCSSDTLLRAAPRGVVREGSPVPRRGARGPRLCLVEGDCSASVRGRYSSVCVSRAKPGGMPSDGSRARHRALPIVVISGR